MNNQLIQKLSAFVAANDRLRAAAQESLNAQHEVEAVAPIDVGARVRYRGRTVTVNRVRLSHDVHELRDEDRKDGLDLCWEIEGDDGNLIVPLDWEIRR